MLQVGSPWVQDGSPKGPVHSLVFPEMAANRPWDLLGPWAVVFLLFLDLLLPVKL